MDMIQYILWTQKLESAKGAAPRTAQPAQTRRASASLRAGSSAVARLRQAFTSAGAGAPVSAPTRA